MSKERSRVAQEAQEAQKRSDEVQKKIKELSTKISNPEKYFAPKPDERTQSTVERFRKYFALDKPVTHIESRKATRSEMRTQRNRALAWCILAILCIIWIGGCLLTH